MLGFFIAWLSAGVVWVLLLLERYRRVAQPSPFDLVLFVGAIIIVWPFILFVLYRKKQRTKQ